MEIDDQERVTFTPEELDTVRAALVTIEHYATNIWDQVEISAVSGSTVDEIVSMRRQLDAIRRT
ncbi:hypothetical protein HPO96_17980 [Kribbella sandramycini]|uniref:Uncharacterized protein n=1 Tax=Kribbella sandramycini TaxID=60450 RepID=A0A7Y4P0Q5_9ACTN|nr:hypothetical protein [Kribbella sandramycini]MBB6565874.1 hypothetical protein [Kribbella sandramycini]NOL42138.1 hypothetical protein [Kribbella sandramycini]